MDDGNTFLSIKEIPEDRLDQESDPARIIQDAMSEVSKSVVDMWEES